MVSRRRFLQVGAAAAAVPLVASPSLSSADTATMPPSLAALKSRRDEAKPITREERTDRQEKARHLMAENKLDAILLMEGTSLNYFTGIRWWGGERTFACVIPAKGEAFYVCPAFEEGRAREQIRNGPRPETADVRTWQEDGNPYQLIAQGLKDRGISTGVLGMEETVRFVFSNGVAKAAPQVQLTSATPIPSGTEVVVGSCGGKLRAHTTVAATV